MLHASATRLAGMVRSAAGDAGIAVQASAVGGMWGFFLTDGTVTDYASAKTSDTERFAALFHALVAEGVYIAPSQFEACFVSTTHDEAVLTRTGDALSRAFRALAT
jgi:glutamate-1-semialdehyde 2,1-aminomutase